jgi:hypothetical protein
MIIKNSFLKFITEKIQVQSCSSNPCQHNTICFSISNGKYACDCTTNYGGTHCELGKCLKKILLISVPKR